MDNYDLVWASNLYFLGFYNTRVATLAD